MNKNVEFQTPNVKRRISAKMAIYSLFRTGRSVFDLPKSILILAVRIYQIAISPAQVFLFGGNCGCRFTPTCSQFAAAAIREHGAITGTVLAAKRICRCHPWGGCGHDPVPLKNSNCRAPHIKNLAGQFN